MSGASSINSYVRYLPDGTLTVGVNSNILFLIDPTSLDVIETNSDIIQGPGGLEVLYVFKETSGVQQVIAAGCDDGCWGSACDLKNGHTLYNCQETACNTVLPGADGMSTYNNKRSQPPYGVLRWTLPFPTNSQTIDHIRVMWPWWISTDVGGNIYVYDNQSLIKYNNDAKQQWSVAASGFFGANAVLDDESALLLSNLTHVVTYDTSTGDMITAIDMTQLFGRGTECVSQISPWQNALPTPLSDSDHFVVVCTNSKNGWFTSVVSLSKGKATSPVLITVPPSQVMVDNSGNLYTVGIVSNKPTIQKVAYP